MIVTILPSSKSFHAVHYNENKVSKGDAILLEMKNFGRHNILGYDNPEELVKYLQDYSSRNTRIKNPQFHIAISCKGDEMTHQELLEFAHKYLKEMGYGEDGQPLLIYAHNDTDNNHIHIITSKVSPNGKKINDSNNWLKSQKIIEKLLGNNERLMLEKKLKDIKEFNFRSVTQYRSILEAMGYECYEKDNKLNIKKGGMVLNSIDIDKIIKNAKINESIFKEPEYNKLFGIFSKYRDINNDLDGLKKDLRKNFGLELVFFGRKDSPYGYAVVDFKNKCVYEGAKIMGIKRLNNFLSPEERKNKIDQFIYKTLNSDNRITTKELNKKLRKLNAFIKDGNINVRGFVIPLSDNIKRQLSINNKLAWIDSFHPQTDDEYKLLLKISGLDNEGIKLPESYKFHKYKDEIVNNINKIFSSKDSDTIKRQLDNAGYRLISFNNMDYIYSSKDRDIINLNRIGIGVPAELKNYSKENLNKLNKQISNNISNNIPNPTNLLRKLSSEPTHGTNREWEVGTKKNNDDPDETNKLSY